MVEQPDLDELGHAVDESGAAHPERLGVADHLERQLAVDDPHALDRPVRGAHPAADLGRLEGGAGRCRRRQHTLGGAERVGADVDEQPQPPVAGQPGREHPRDDVPADIGAERREHEGRRPRVRGDPEVGGERRRQLVRRDDERGHRQRLGVDAEGLDVSLLRQVVASPQAVQVAEIIPIVRIIGEEPHRLLQQGDPVVAIPAWVAKI